MQGGSGEGRANTPRGSDGKERSWERWEAEAQWHLLALPGLSSLKAVFPLGWDARMEMIKGESEMEGKQGDTKENHVPVSFTGWAGRWPGWETGGDPVCAEGASENPPRHEHRPKDCS